MSDALAKAFENLKSRFKPNKVSEKMTFYFSLGDADGQKDPQELAGTFAEPVPDGVVDERAEPPQPQHGDHVDRNAGGGGGWGGSGGGGDRVGG